jgi:hypothetical protein
MKLTLKTITFRKYGALFFIVIGLIAHWGCQKTSQNMFTIMGARETGLDFNNRIEENDSFNVLGFEYIYNGGGVGVGDFNGDGLSDVFFAGNQRSSALYLNRGGLHFEDVSAKAGLQTRHWCTGVSVVDINGDGWLDIYVCTIHPNRKKSAPNLFYINQGPENGIPIFKEQAAEMGLADHAYSTHAGFLDYDLDGDLDMYLLNNALEDFNRNEIRKPSLDGTGKSNDQLFRNEGKIANGLPRFSDVSLAAGITQEGWGLGLGICDINQDGYPDIYCANDFLSSDLLWINKQDGTFSNQVSDYFSHQSHNSMGCDIADIDNDGYPELMTLDMMPFTNRRIKSMFGPASYDRYQLNLQLGYQPQFVRNMLQHNNGPDENGQISFSEIGQMAGVFATDWSWSCLFADFDNDSQRDLFITNGYHRDVTDLDFTAYNAEVSMFGDPQMRKKAIEKVVNKLEGVKISNFIYHNGGDLSFADRSREWGIQRPSYSNGAAYADFDNDGDLDLVVNNINDPAFLYRNNLYNTETCSNNYLRLHLEGKRGNKQALGAKVEVFIGRKRLSAEHNLYRGYKSSMEEAIHFGLGQEKVVDSVRIKWPDGKWQKLDRPRINSLLKIAYQPNTNNEKPRQVNQTLLKPLAGQPGFSHRENPWIDFNQQFLWRRMYSRQGPAMVQGDVNGDGLSDVLLSGASEQAGVVFLQKSDGHFVQQNWIEAKRQEHTSLAFFDADQDGDLDVYAVGGGTEFPENSEQYQDQLYLNDGKGHFQAAPKDALPSETSSGACVAKADYDQDGDLDLFVAGRISPERYPFAPRSFLLRNDGQKGRAKFTDVTPADLKNPGMVCSAIWADFDENGTPDLALTGEYMSIDFWYNQAGHLQQKKLENSRSLQGWWNTLYVADLDGDGDQDLLGGNFGLNTRYQASLEQPLCINAKDYDNNGRLDPFFSYFLQGKEVLVHPRDALTMQTPALKKRVLTYAEYGRLGLYELLKKPELAGALHLEAHTLQSVWLENKGQGKWETHALPRLAQTGPIQAFVVEDFDRDGKADILCLGNDYGEDVQIGRQDALGAILLRNQGKGRFKAQSAKRSGIRIVGDPRSAQVLCINKQKQLWVGMNQGPLLRWQW